MLLNNWRASEWVTIVAIDPDVFEEHNLNRQLYSSIRWVGQIKGSSCIGARRGDQPSSDRDRERVAYTPENGIELLQGAHVVVDALDSIPTEWPCARRV